MKFEKLLLQGLFGACLLVCLMVVGGMLTSRTPVAVFAASQAPAASAVQGAG